jgi:lipopolysaccharide transport system ATP-binding protein
MKTSKKPFVVGIAEGSGSGKTTLLKILSCITEPTEGYAEIRGRVGSLLEVGTGFHPELSGRENIYLNGAILGMRRAEIERKFDEIVDFAGVEKFVDTPVKRYSSGMHVRLAFAVAAHLEPEILLVDEVLAVGDAEFRKKCLGKMNDIASGGRTIVFVSHNMGAVRRLCRRVVWLTKGEIVAVGNADTVIADYLDASTRGFAQTGLESDSLRIEQIVLRDRHGNPKVSFLPGENISIEIRYYAKRSLYKPYFWLGISGPYGLVLAANMMADGHSPERIEGKGTLMCTFKQIPLLPQSYSVSMGVRDSDGVTRLVKPAEVAFFSVGGSTSELGLDEENADSIMWYSAPAFSPYEWQMPDGKTIVVTPPWLRSV